MTHRRGENGAATASLRSTFGMAAGAYGGGAFRR